MLGGFFASRRVLVTGVAGVRGTWLALLLLDAGANVLGVDIRAPEADSNFVASGLASRIRFAQGDITNLALSRKLVDEAEYVFHLAALALVHDGRRDPWEAYRTNTLGTAAVLEAVRLATAPKRAVLVTTDKFYSPKAGESWVETDRLGASGRYAVSKACAEFIIADYQKTYFAAGGSRIAVARAGNVLVGGDLHSSTRNEGAGRIFVDCFAALAEGRAPRIFNPNFTRPYIYGLDVLCGYMTLMAGLERDDLAGEAFDFGPYERHGIPNALLATKICQLWGGDTTWHTGSARDEPFEYQSLSFEKSRQLLRWSPAYTLYEAIAATACWYKEWALWRRDRFDGGLAELNASLIHEHRQAAVRLGIGWARAATKAEAAAGD